MAGPSSIRFGIALTILCVSSVSAAIIRGTDNGDGSWTISSTTISLQTGSNPLIPLFGQEDSVVFDRDVRISLTSAGGPPFVAFRRDADLARNDRAVQATIPVFSSFVGDFGAGAQAGTDSYLLLSLEPSQSDWDTVIQFEFDSGVGLAGDRILGIWHDNSASGENILTDISSFSELDDLAIPEPSTALLSLTAIVGLLRRRRS